MSDQNMELGDRIFEGSMQGESDIVMIPEAAQKLFREFCLLIPGILGEELLGKGLTSVNYLKAKLAVARHMIETKLHLRVSQCDPAYLSEKEAQEITNYLGLCITELERVLEDAHKILLAQADEFERDFFETHKLVRFNPTTLARKREGRMSVRDLLLLEPSRIIQAN